MVDALRAHPAVKVYNAVVKPPATEAALRQAEKQVGAPLPKGVRAFYAAHDGVFLAWGLRGKAYERMPPFGYPDYGQPPGCINLLPVRKAMSPTWEKSSYVNQVQPAHQKLLFGAPLDPQPPVRAVCFDNFSMYNHAELVFGPDPVVIVSTDHGADLESSHFLDFETYLDMTLGLYGCNRYDHGVGIGSSRKPQRVASWGRKTGLDQLIAKIAADPE
jgi:hypothetical protein